MRAMQLDDLEASFQCSSGGVGKSRFEAIYSCMIQRSGHGMRP